MPGWTDRKTCLQPSHQLAKESGTQGMDSDERQHLRSRVQEPPSGNYAWVVEHEQALGFSRSSILAIWAERLQAKVKQVKPLIRYSSIHAHLQIACLLAAIVPACQLQG